VNLPAVPIFDYIIVGSGVAGSVLAHRLAFADHSRKVLLIEAGDVPLINSFAPRFFPFNLNNSASFKFFAEKSEKFSLAMENSTNINVGKCLGGSSQLNAMLYVCGSDKVYDNWAKMVDDESWNYKNMLQFIIKHQNNQDKNLTEGKCGKFHGKEGPLNVTTIEMNSDPLIEILQNSAKELNFKELKDINCGPDEGYTGFVNMQMTIQDGTRVSSARSFLTPLRNLNNFYLMRNGFVDKILMRKDSKGRALVEGLSVMTNEKKCRNIKVRASREIILSAGALNTPKILLNSGEF
jgi:choline dehydrogenase